MKLKLTKDGHAVVRDGKPVYTHDDGREEAFDAPTAMKMLVGKHFETSAIAGGLKIPHEMAAAAFGGKFRVENGQLVAYDKGDDVVPVYSQTRFGSVATFEEALGQIIDRYPNKDMIQRKDAVPAPAPGRQSQSTTTRISRTQFDSLPPASRAKFFKDGGTIDDGASAAAHAAPAAARPSSGSSMKREIFDALSPINRMSHIRSGGHVVD